VSDADFAVAAAIAPARPTVLVPRDDREIHSLQVGRGSVTAACQAVSSGEIFLGFEKGLICVFEPEREQVVELRKDYGAVVAISADPHGQSIAALYEARAGLRMCCFSKRPDGSYVTCLEIPLAGAERSWLTPIMLKGVERLVGVSDGTDLFVFDVAAGLPRQRLRVALDPGIRPRAGFLIDGGLFDGGPGNARSAKAVTLLTHDSDQWVVVDSLDDRVHETGCKWLPQETGAHSMQFAPLSWRHVRSLLELAGVDGSGAVHASEFYTVGQTLRLIGSRVATTEAGYVGATHAGSSTVMAVSPAGIDWLRYRGNGFRPAQHMELSLPSAVACFAIRGQDALVVCSRGLVIRVAAPRRASAARKLGKEGLDR
jgi:hypothetical protein